jgi:hypothetical protein
VDWFGLYDCFPICFIRAVEAAGLADEGEGGAWVERMHVRLQQHLGYPPLPLPLY